MPGLIVTCSGVGNAIVSYMVRWQIISVVVIALLSTVCKAHAGAPAQATKSSSVDWQKYYLTTLRNTDKAIAHDKKSPWGYCTQAQLLSALGDFTAAVRAADKSIAADAKFAPAYQARSIANYQLGHYEQALADAKRCQQLNQAHRMPPESIAVPLAAAYLGLKQPDKARKLADDAIKRNPRLPGALVVRAKLDLQNNNYKSALQNADSAIAFAKNSAEAYQTRADVFDKLGKKAQVAADRQKAKTLAKEKASVLAQYRGRMSRG